MNSNSENTFGMQTVSSTLVPICRRLRMIGAPAVVIGLLLSAGAGPCHAQALPPLRGVYTTGFNATNSGVMPEPGVTYSNTFLDYSFDQLVCSNCGDLRQSFSAAVFIDVNVIMWVSKKKILGANYALVAGLPVTNSALSLSGLGAIAGGGGFADSFYQPITLGWHLKRADIMAAYAFFAPTGRYTAGASNNTGTGHWTHCLTVGETVYLTKNKATAFSSYQMYEFHSTQDGTDIRPGQTFDLDYSLTQILPLDKDMHVLLQFGVIGYEQWQMTDNSGGDVDPSVPGHYRVNAVGAVANILLPARKAGLGIKYFKEFSNSWTVQGYSLQIAGGITF